MDDDAPRLTIGQVAARSGLPVRTIRFWSDAGVVTPAGRTASGRRLYDAPALARLELVATLRELGLGLAEVREVAEKEITLAEVAALHVDALDAQIRLLRMRRGVLAVVARRALDNEEMTLVSRLARLSAQERTQIIDDFVSEVFRDLKPEPPLSDRTGTCRRRPSAVRRIFPRRPGAPATAQDYAATPARAPSREAQLPLSTGTVPGTAETGPQPR
jgi:DNA-binding transcriptional MerR regulator